MKLLLKNVNETNLAEKEDVKKKKKGTTIDWSIILQFHI